jgi:Calpain family cysteine protease
VIHIGSDGYKVNVTRTTQLLTAAVVFAILAQAGLPVSAGDVVEKTPQLNPWALYSQQKYAASADAFESLIRTSTPNARLYYYAALANRGSNRFGRAKQLCQYVITNFPGSGEAAYAQKLYPDAVTKSAKASDALPDSLKGKNIQELMKTEEGRKAVEEALAKKEAATVVAAAKVSPMIAKSKGGRTGDHVFASADIAKDGAGGIDQMYYPNCWFESSMSALAMLPRGQKLMADMIRYGDKEGHYVVRFPGDGAEYKITEENLEKSGIHNKALWATLIECGQTLKFPNDAGGQLADGLGCLTGQKADTISPGGTSPQELRSFIEGAVKSQNPIICGSQYSLTGLPRLVIASHAYTIIGFESASGMITIRNPHGANAQRFTLTNDERHEKFEQLNDGVFKIHISLFPYYFSQVARANI